MRTMILITSLLAVSACATSSMPNRADRLATLLDDPRVGEKTDRICFSSTIDSFSRNMRDSVVLTRGVKDDFLVIVSGCPRLDNAQSIGLVNRASCLTRADRLIVSDSVFSLQGNTPIGPDRCFVDDIYVWDEDAGVSEEEDGNITE